MAAASGLSMAIALIYGLAFYRRAPRPISDMVLTVVTMTMVGIAIEARGLTGVLWCYPLILFFYLVMRRQAALVFNIGTVLIAILLCYIKYDGTIAFRVGITLFLGSAFAIVYARILRSQQILQEEQHQRLDLLLRCSNIGSLEWDSTTGNATISERLRDMLGLDASTLTVNPALAEFVPPEDRDRIVKAFNDLVGPPGPAGSTRQSESENFRVTGRHGRKLWVHVDATVILGNDGRPQKLIASFLDATPMLSAEESMRAALQAMQRSSVELEAIFDTVTLGIAVVRERRFVRCNRRFEELLGHPANGLIGQSTRLLYASDEDFNTIGAAAYPILEQGGVHHREQIVQRLDGSIFVGSFTGKAFDASRPNEGSVWMLEDITERRQAEEDTRRALEQQRELNELKMRFVSMASHEFRTPLATILSSTDLIRYYGDRLPVDEKTILLGSIEKGVKRMTEMLDNILVIGRTDAGKLEFMPTPVNVSDLCRAIAEESVRAHAPDDGLNRLDLSIQCPSEKAMLDEKLMRHILGNLLSNAFKYSPAGGRVRFSVSVMGGRLSVCVEDSGIGIPPDDLSRLFETFHRAANVGSISGTGLGMVIVKRAAELHGGSIEVHSTVGVGTRFDVTLPWQPVADSSEQAVT